jgi:hypothetical protein
MQEIPPPCLPELLVFDLIAQSSTVKGTSELQDIPIPLFELTSEFRIVGETDSMQQIASE